MKNDDRLFFIGVCCAVAVTLGAFLWFNRGALMPEYSTAGSPPAGARDSQRRVVVAPTPSLSGPAPPAEVAPAVRRASLQDVASQPPGWSVGTDGSRRFAAVVEAVAAGSLPDLDPQSLPDLREVLVRTDRDGRLVVASGTHRRYAWLVERFATLDPAEVADFAARESGLVVEEGGDDLETILRSAIDHLLEVEPPEVEPDMVSRGSYWGFADVDSEALSPVQKHLLLMGRDNARLIRDRLVELRDLIGDADAATTSEPEPATPERPVVAERVAGRHADAATSQP